MRRVGILISGGGSNMVSLVESMTGDHPARAALVLSNVPGAGGLDKAAARGIPTAVVDHKDFPKDRPGFENAMMRELQAAEVDLLCFAGFMRITTPEFADAWAGRALNIHPSLLPKYPGLNTHARALEAKDPEHGCTVHEVIPELDAGPILGQARIKVQPDDTPDLLAQRVLPMEHRLYPAVLRRFCDGIRTPLVLE